jgi:hypothetical protein
VTRQALGLECALLPSGPCRTAPRTRRRRRLFAAEHGRRDQGRSRRPT